MTHSELVNIGVKFLRKLNYPIIVAEQKSASSEIPDVIGFKFDHSTLLECKCSRSDFLIDKKKPHRLINGVGNFRFFICDEELIKTNELPENWGLIYVSENGNAFMVHNPYGKIGGNIWMNGFDSNQNTERQILFTHIRKNK